MDKIPFKRFFREPYSPSIPEFMSHLCRPILKNYVWVSVKYFEHTRFITTRLVALEKLH